MADPKSPSTLPPELSPRVAAEDPAADAGALAERALADPAMRQAPPLLPELVERYDRVIRAWGLAAARERAPALAGHCIECGEPVPGRRAFCSDACIARRVHGNRQKVAAIAREGRTPRNRRD